MCLPIGSMLLRSKILWMKHVVFWREPDGVIPRATGDWLTGRWDSRKVLRHCHNTWKTSTYARRCWSSRFWHSDWKSGLFPDFYRKYSKVRTFPGPGGQQLKIRTFPGNKDPWEPCSMRDSVYLYIRTVPCIFSWCIVQCRLPGLIKKSFWDNNQAFSLTSATAAATCGAFPGHVPLLSTLEASSASACNGTPYHQWGWDKIGVILNMTSAKMQMYNTVVFGLPISDICSL